MRFVEQTAEHLVENVDIPVPHGCGGRDESEVFRVSLNRIQQRLLEQIVLTFQFRAVEVFKVLA